MSACGAHKFHNNHSGRSSDGDTIKLLWHQNHHRYQISYASNEHTEEKMTNQECEMSEQVICLVVANGCGLDSK